MTDFLEDRTSLPTGKTTSRVSSLPENERLTPQNWEDVCLALYSVRDMIAFDFTGVTLGLGAGESVELAFGAILGVIIADGGAARVEVEVIAKGDVTGTRRVQSWHASYTIRKTAGVTTIVDTAGWEQTGDDEASSWTFAASVAGGPDRVRFDFTTGTTTSLASVKANVWVTKV